MEDTQVMEFAHEAVILVIKISGPIMLVGLIAGLIVALFQALTQIQEMTLAFVPKIIAIFVALLLMLPMMGQMLIDFTQRIADQIVGMG